MSSEVHRPTNQPKLLAYEGDIYISLKTLPGLISKVPLLEAQRKLLAEETSMTQGSKGENIAYLPRVDKILELINSSFEIEKSDTTVLNTQQKIDNAVKGIQKLRESEDADSTFLSEMGRILGINGQGRNLSDSDRRNHIKDSVTELKSQNTRAEEREEKLKEQAETLEGELTKSGDPHQIIRAVLVRVLGIDPLQLSTAEKLALRFAMKELGVQDFDEHKI